MERKRQGTLIYDEESIEMDDRWYLVGVKTDQLAGLRVRM